MTAKKYIIHGESPESEPHEWSGCGWIDEGHGKPMTDVDSWRTERRMNRAAGLEGWIAWRIEL